MAPARSLARPRRSPSGRSRSTILNIEGVSSEDGAEPELRYRSDSNHGWHHHPAAANSSRRNRSELAPAQNLSPGFQPASCVPFAHFFFIRSSRFRDGKRAPTLLLTRDTPARR